MTGHQSPKLFSEGTSEPEKDDLVRIVRRGVLRKTSEIGGKGESPWLDENTDVREEIAFRAIDIGYKPGEIVRYKIIIDKPYK